MACYDPVGTKCSGKAQKGSIALKNFAVETWDLPMVGIYNCRSSRAGSSLSLHAEGRAVDLHVHIRCSECKPDAAEEKLGWSMAAFLIDNHAALGVQRVIWLNRTWSAENPKWHAYTGPFHGNHVHVELCWKAALENTIDTYKAVGKVPGASNPTPQPEEDEMTPVIVYSMERPGAVYLLAGGNIIHLLETDNLSLQQQGIKTLHFSGAGLDKLYKDTWHTLNIGA